MRNAIAGVAGLLLAAMGATGAGAQGQDGALNSVTTARVLSAIEAVFEACQAVDMVYQPDCVGKAFQSGASKISNNPAYWEAHVALTRLSRGLERAVRASRDDTVGRLRAGGFRVNAVNAAALPGIAAQTERDIARAAEDFQRLNPLEKEAFAPLLDMLVTQRPWP